MPARLERVEIVGIRAILRALRDLPDEAQQEVRDGSLALAQELAGDIRATAGSDSPQSAVAATTVFAKRDRVPVINAGTRGTKKAKALVLPSNFGMKRKSGWYRATRYFDSPGRQFREWNGGAGQDDYWFFRTVEREQAKVTAAYLDMIEGVIRRWAD